MVFSRGEQVLPLSTRDLEADPAPLAWPAAAVAPSPSAVPKLRVRAARVPDHIRNSGRRVCHAVSSAVRQRVLDEQCLEARVVADGVPQRIQVQLVDAEPGRTREQPLDLMERSVRLACLCQDLRATFCRQSAVTRVLTVDQRLLQPASLSKRLVATAEARQGESVGYMHTPVIWQLQCYRLQKEACCIKGLGAARTSPRV